MEKEYQSELFEDFKDKESRLKYIAKKIIPGQKHKVVNLSFEAIILCVILIVLGLIVSFALGVEAGKKRANITAKQEKKPVPQRGAVKSLVVKEKVKETTSKAVPAKAEAISTGYKLFTVQVVSTKDKRLALEKAKELKLLGYASTVLYNEGNYQVCAGAYATRAEAQKEQIKLQGLYKGCFVKNR